MKMLKTTLLFSLSAISFITSKAQTADEIVSKWTAAMGGKEKLASIQSVYLENELDIMNNTAPAKIYILNGKGFKSETDFNGQTIIDCYTVNDGWSVNPLAGQPTATRMPEAQIKPGQLRLDAQGVLFNYDEKGSKIELAGKEDLNGIPVYKIILTTASGVKDVLHLDAKTFYILKETSVIAANGQEFEISTSYSDYRKTDNGYIMPYSNILTLPGVSATTTCKKIEVNKPIDPAVFAMPKN
jgi:outer membrane lipoprotein-sorting protein